MRRGEIAIGVVIVIALGLIVLISLATLLINSTDRARETTNACADTYGGSCMTKQNCQANDGRVIGGISCNADFSKEYNNDWGIYSYPSGGGVCCVT